MSACQLTYHNRYKEWDFLTLLNAFSRSGFEVPFFFHYDQYSISPTSGYLNQRNLKNWFLENSLNLPESKIKPILVDYMRKKHGNCRRSDEGFSPGFVNGLHSLIDQTGFAVGMETHLSIFINGETRLSEKALNPEILLLPVLEYFFEMVDFYARNCPQLNNFRKISPPTIQQFDPALLQSYNSVSTKLVKAVAGIREQRALTARLEEERQKNASVQQFQIEEIERPEENAEYFTAAVISEEDADDGDYGDHDEPKANQSKRYSAASFAFQRLCDLTEWVKEKLRHLLHRIRNTINNLLRGKK